MFKKTETKIVVTIMALMVLLLAGTLFVIYMTSYIELYNNNQEMLETYIDIYSVNGNPAEDELSDGAEELPEEDETEGSSDEVRESSETEILDAGGLPDEAGRPGNDDLPGPDDGTVQDEDAGLPENDITPDEPRGNDEPLDNNGELPKSAQTYMLSTFYSVAFVDGEADSVDNNGDILYTDEQLVVFAEAILKTGREEGIYDTLVYRVQTDEDSSLVVMMDNTIVGESITALFRYTLIFGSIACVLIFFMALFLSRQIVRPLRDMYDQQKQFISDAGHELKTSIAAVNTNMEILSRELAAQGMEDNQWLTNIRFENDRMTAVIHQLLELSRVENVPPEMEQLDFGRLVTREILSFEAVAFEKGFTISYSGTDESSGKEIMVMGNAEQLGRLIVILLDNAVQHASKQGEIQVQLSEKHNKAYLTVTNEGEEIPPEQQKLIFQRFYRADYARNGEDSHYGLGLAIAKAVAESHSGNISVSCGQGLVSFIFSLPVKR